MPHHAPMFTLVLLGVLLAEAAGEVRVPPPLVSRMTLKKAEGCPCEVYPSVLFPGFDEVKCVYSQLTEVPTECFSEKVAAVFLALNMITKIGPSDFVNLKNLRQLDLMSNRIESVDPEAFRSLLRLESLHMSYNKDLRSLPESVFHGLTNLERIVLDKTPLESLPDLSHQTHLEHLSATDCQISSLRRPSFGNVTTSMAFVVLEENRIEHAALDAISTFQDEALFYFDYTTTLWAQNQEELLAVLEKPYHFSFETVPVMDRIKVCGQDGLPDVEGVCDLSKR